MTVLNLNEYNSASSAAKMRCFKEKCMKGIFYGIGTGPGDPELMTLKAVRIIKENEIIAVPCTEPKRSAAYKTAVQAVPELSGKTLLPTAMPMTEDKRKQSEAHMAAAERRRKRCLYNARRPESLQQLQLSARYHKQ